MMPTRQQFIDELLTFEGTPYQHQGRQKGNGVDCFGFIIGALGNLGVEVSSIPQTYKRIPNPDKLMQGLESTHYVYQLTQADVLKSGDILVFLVGGYPRHFGVLLEDELMIHSFYKQNVVITDIRAWEGMLHSVWRLKFSDEVVI